MGVLIGRTPDRRPDQPNTVQRMRAAALFASTLQASEHPSAEQVRGAVATTLRRLGTAGCSARLGVGVPHVQAVHACARLLDRLNRAD